MPPKKSVTTLEQLKKKIKKDKKLAEDAIAKETQEIEKTIQKEKKAKKEKVNKATLFELEKYIKENKILDEKISAVNKKIDELNDEITAVDIDEDDYKEKIKRLQNTLKANKAKINNFIEEKKKNNTFIEELSKTRAGFERGEGDILDNDEKKVFKVLKELMTLKEEAIKSGTKFSSSVIKEKFDELIEEGELTERNVEILEKIYKLSQNQIVNFYNQYIRKDENFFEFLEAYTSLLEKLDPQELSKMSKKELIDLAASKGIKGLSGKSIKEIISILLQDRCDPSLNILCTEVNKVCDISSYRGKSVEFTSDVKGESSSFISHPGICISKPKEIPNSYSLHLFKNSYLYGKTKEVNDLVSRLEKLLKYENGRIREKDMKEIDEKIARDIQREELIKEAKIASEKRVATLRQRQKNRPTTLYTFTSLYNPLNECLKVYERRPWIKEFVKAYITRPDFSKPEERFIAPDLNFRNREEFAKYNPKVSLETTLKKYPKTNEIEFNNKVFYEAGKLFNLLNCNKYSKDRKQDGNILTLFDREGNEEKFIVLLEYNSNKLKYQDEDVFKKELKYFEPEKAETIKRIENIKEIEIGESREFNSLVRSFVIDSLHYSLNNILSKQISEDTSEEDKKVGEIEADLVYSFSKKLLNELVNDIQTIYDRLDDKKEIKELEELYNSNTAVLKSLFQRSKKLEDFLNFFKGWKEEISGFDRSYKDDLSEILDKYIEKFNKAISQLKANIDEIKDLDTLKLATEIEEAFRDSMSDTQSVYEYLQAVSRFFVFINGNNKLSKYAHQFKSRVIHRFFNPGYYTYLKFEEVLPQYFLNPDLDVEIKNKLVSNIEHEIENQTIDFLKTLDAAIFNPTARWIDLSHLKYSTNYSYLDTLPSHLCYHTIDYEDWEIVPYLEDDKVYCFTIYELNDLYLSENFFNPETGKPFSDDLVHFIWAENIPEVVKEDLQKVEEEKEAQKRQKEEDSKLLSEITSRIKLQIARDQRKIGMNEGEEVCKYCEKVMEGKEGYYSVLKSDKGSRRVAFCNLECFEKASFRKEK